jgi:hypothetical protein
MAAGGTADGTPALRAGERRKRKRHHRSSRTKRRLRIVLYVGIHLVGMAVLIFLWLKIID